MPLSISRQLATWRPVGFLGQNAARIGSILSHNASGTSQIVPSGLRRDFRRTMVAAPDATPGGGLIRYNLLHAKGVPTVLG
jgi:hypothetical protein